MGGDAARICAQNFEAVLTVVVKLPGDLTFDVFFAGTLKNTF